MKKTGKLFNILFIISAGFVSVCCEDIWNRCVDGNGDRIIDNRDLTAFERIEVNGDFDVRIDTADYSSVAVETDENLIDLIVTHVSGNKLIIETRDGICIRPAHPVEITITTSTLNEVTLNGSGFVYCSGVNSENFSVNLAGSGEIECDNVTAIATEIELEGSGLIDCNLITQGLQTQLEGSGEIKLHGDCISADHKIIGSGKINAALVNSDECVAYISGSGIIDVDVNNTLDVTIIGSGRVYYTGNPIIQEYISGSGDVIER